MMSADWGLGTTKVVTGKLALFAPAGTVTLGGTVAAFVSSLDSATVKPPVGAAAVSVTVPVTGVPPTTSVGLTFTVESAAAGDGAGAGAGEGEGEGEGVVLTLQPESVAVVAVAEPSLTATRQPAGLANESRWSLKLPAPSLDVIATPSTVIWRLAVAVPSMRSCVPFSSAFETRTVASALDVTASRQVAARTASRLKRV